MSTKILDALDKKDFILTELWRIEFNNWLVDCSFQLILYRENARVYLVQDDEIFRSDVHLNTLVVPSLFIPLLQFLSLVEILRQYYVIFEAIYFWIDRIKCMCLYLSFLREIWVLLGSTDCWLASICVFEALLSWIISIPIFSVVRASWAGYHFEHCLVLNGSALSAMMRMMSFNDIVAIPNDTLFITECFIVLEIDQRTSIGEILSKLVSLLRSNLLRSIVSLGKQALIALCLTVLWS